MYRYDVLFGHFQGRYLSSLSYYYDRSKRENLYLDELVKSADFPSTGSSGRGARALRIFQRSDTERQGQHRHTELEAPADGEGRRWTTADGGGHPGRTDVGGDPEDSGVPVQATAAQSSRRG